MKQQQETLMRNTNSEFEWTDDTIRELRQLWSEGHSTAEIGRRMGVTKNTVVGKAHRLDLPARPSPIRSGGSPRPPHAQGNRSKKSSCALQDGVKVIRVPSGQFTADLEAFAWLGRAQQVHHHMADGGHVVRAVSGSQTREVLMEDDIQHPMQTVLDMPMAAHRVGELAASRSRSRCSSGVRMRFRHCARPVLDHGDGLDAGEAAVAGQPVDACG